MPGELPVARPLIGGQHDQENVGKNGRGINAKGNRGHVRTVGSLRQAVRLPGVEKISTED